MSTEYVMHDNGLMLPAGYQQPPKQSEHLVEFFAYATMGTCIDMAEYALRPASEPPTRCRYLGDVPGSNCSEWECPKCERSYVSPTAVFCECKDAHAPPAAERR